MKHILIVDDAATVRLYYRNTLEGAGYEVDEAVNGMEALERAVAAPYDLYLVDVNMPILDGYSFLRELRARDELSQAPAMMISTEVQPQDAADVGLTEIAQGDEITMEKGEAVIVVPE